jgi:sterol desaturase/sphingolipid hydroxylase (fatty acid hydroxylase superfamily)
MNRTEPVRIFKSNFLEFFTHIHPWQIAVVWGLVDAFFLYRGIMYPGGTVSRAVHIPLAFIAGLLLWTLSEYVLHRWIFHFKPRTPFQERMSFMFHGVHHAQPMVKTRLVMPFPLGIPLAGIFCGLFYLITAVILGSPHLFAPTFSGFLTGYLIYDLGHYSFHHLKTKNAYLLFLRKHHMRHHGADSTMRYGVSSPLWDYIFGTMPKDSTGTAS